MGAAANLWSGLGAAVAVALCGALARRAVREEEGEALAAAIPPALLALNPVLLSECMKAEVNTWSLAWTFAAVLLFVRFLGALERAEGWISLRAAAAWGLLCGAGLAHHALSLLVSLPLSIGLAVALLRRGRLAPKLPLVAAAAALLPLLSYGFVVWRAFHPAPGQWPDIEPTFRGIAEHLTGERYRMYLGFFAPDAENRRWLSTSVYPFLVPGLACLGVAVLRTKTPTRRITWMSLLTAAGLVLLFTLQYGVPDPAPYLLPALGISALGLAAVLGSITRSSPAAVSRAIGVTGFVLSLCLGWGHIVDAREDRASVARFDRDVRRLWARVPADSGIVLWPADQVARLVEYQVLRAEKPAVWVTTPDFLLGEPALEHVRRRYGVDLMAGLTVPYAPWTAPWGAEVRGRFFDTVIARLNASTRVPVYWFDPVEYRLVPLVKPNPQRRSAA